MPRNIILHSDLKAEVYSCASDRQQAAIVFDVAVDMVKQSPALMKRIKIIPSTKRMVYQPTGSIYQVLSSEVATKHGLNVSACIFDELHTQPTRALFDVMTQGSGDARKQPLWFFLTTAGTDRNSICWEVHQKALDIIEGRKVDPRFYPVIFGLPDEADWTSEVISCPENRSAPAGIPAVRTSLMAYTVRPIASCIPVRMLPNEAMTANGALPGRSSSKRIRSAQNAEKTASLRLPRLLTISFRTGVIPFCSGIAPTGNRFARTATIIRQDAACEKEVRIVKNPFARVFRARDKPQDAVSSAPTFYFGSSASGKAVNPSSAIRVSAVYACVRVIAETIASLPFHVYESSDNGSRKATEHPLYRLIHDEPNREMTSFILRETLMAHLLLYGNAYCQIIRTRFVSIEYFNQLPETRRPRNGDLLFTVTGSYGMSWVLKSRWTTAGLSTERTAAMWPCSIGPSTMPKICAT